MSEPLIEAEGFLFANDLHLTSRRPGKRIDADYADRVLAKLARCVAIANEHRLVLVLGGDVFHHSKEDSEALKTKLKRVLAECWTVPWTNVGSHDCKGLRLSDADTLSMIGESGRILKVCRDAGPAAEFMFRGVRVGLGFSPARQDIPRDVRAMFPEANAVVWCTHHDVAFEGAYPGALVPFEIAGCSLVVNAHMHLRKEPVYAGQTTWCNFGSVTRTASDAIAHEPCAWQLTPTGELVCHELPFERDAFDTSGSLIAAISPGEVEDEADGSEFVDQLKAHISAEPAATPSGEVLLDEMRARMRQENLPQEVCLALETLWGQATGAAA